MSYGHGPFHCHGFKEKETTIVLLQNRLETLLLSSEARLMEHFMAFRQSRTADDLIQPCLTSNHHRASVCPFQGI